MAGKDAVAGWGLSALQDADPEVFELIEKEKNRQWKCLELIASENLTSRSNGMSWIMPHEQVL